jgi:hypothetical protein
MTHGTTTHIHDPDPPNGTTLADLDPNGCRYPFGNRDITFCDKPQQDGSSYCPAHHAICWVKPTGRRAAA